MTTRTFVSLISLSALLLLVVHCASPDDPEACTAEGAKPCEGATYCCPDGSCSADCFPDRNLDCNIDEDCHDGEFCCFGSCDVEECPEPCGAAADNNFCVGGEFCCMGVCTADPNDCEVCGNTICEVGLRCCGDECAPPDSCDCVVDGDCGAQEFCCDGPTGGKFCSSFVCDPPPEPEYTYSHYSGDAVTDEGGGCWSVLADEAATVLYDPLPASSCSADVTFDITNGAFFETQRIMAFANPMPPALLFTESYQVRVRELAFGWVLDVYGSQGGTAQEVTLSPAPPAGDFTLLVETTFDSTAMTATATASVDGVPAGTVTNNDMGPPPGDRFGIRATSARACLTTPYDVASP